MVVQQPWQNYPSYPPYGTHLEPFYCRPFEHQKSVSIVRGALRPGAMGGAEILAGCFFCSGIATSLKFIETCFLMSQS